MASGVWLTTTQVLSMICRRPSPLASVLREKNTPFSRMRSCAACRFMHTTAGMMPPAGDADAVLGATGTTMGVDAGAGAAAVVGATVIVLGAAVTVVVIELVAVEVLFFSSPTPEIPATTKSATTAAIPPKIQGFFDFFAGLSQNGWPEFDSYGEGAWS